ncbi:enoyl-CoA hydratase-related protein [Conexibacter sp. SYSU D00693]|uniref:enoyl-CoA hydratase-related protein n=1 Tax=Conexibacter sp. SYSU D00693 TaxID=2812560 RepID=UPI00196B832E|nr:enoyl-CoA hydratase-related protein [Conexibacter sp. SYSU D00693]
MPTLEREGDVFVLDLGADENRFHPDWLAELRTRLDEAASTEGPKALVTTGSGKFFSNGLDLDWLGANGDKLAGYVHEIHGVFAQVLAFPAPTVAAIQGHAFAGGGMLALAHDLRVMREDRGWFCLPEADINIPFSRGMTALIQAKLDPAAQAEAMLTARRYTGPEALGAGIVEATAAEAEVRSTAIARAAALAGKDGLTQATIKRRMYATALALLEDRESNPLE